MLEIEIENDRRNMTKGQTMFNKTLHRKLGFYPL
jgi:hypothetical protein